MRRICILGLNRVFDSALILTRDVLTASCATCAEDGGPRPTIPRLLSVSGEDIRTAGGLRVDPDGDLSAGDDADLVIVPGYGVEGTEGLETVLAFLSGDEAQTAGRWLLDLRGRGAMIAAGCTATFLLAEMGLLDGLQATTSWWLADAFRARYPTVDLQPHMMLTSHDRIICAGAAMAHMDLALRVSSVVYGPSVADRVARTLLLDERSSQARYMAASHLAHTHPDIVQAESWIRAHIAERIRVEDIATAVALSPRTLARRFVETTGEAPLRFVQRLRIDHAVHLLETSDLPFSQIAARVGYLEPAGLRRILRRETGCAPSEFRRSRREPPA